MFQSHNLSCVSEGALAPGPGKGRGAKRKQQQQQEGTAAGATKRTRRYENCQRVLVLGKSVTASSGINNLTTFLSSIVVTSLLSE